MEKVLKIAVTGAAGFIGQHLLEDISPGQFSLRVITRNASKPLRVLPVDCEVVEADLLNFHSLTKAFDGVDVVINIAAEVRNANMLVQTNIEGVKNLISAAVEKGVKKIIHISSVGVVGMQYGNVRQIVDEEAECFPKIEYERTKLESEKLLIEARKKHNFILNILRPTNVFGEYHPFNALLNFMSYTSNNKPMVGTSNAMVNYVYVKDLTALILQLVKDDREYGILNVGSSSSLIDFSSLISQSLN